MFDATPQHVRRLPAGEFTAMLALLFATIAFSIDAMLPALPAISAELSPDAVNNAQLVLSLFVLGMGVGTLFVGPISDAIGRKITIAWGAALYVIGAALAWHSTGLEALLLARFLQGLGASTSRVVGMALVRDLYAGREMARIMSFVMMVFMVVPALAPLIGQAIIGNFGWRAIFLAYILFALVSLSWVSLRQAETLAPEDRRPLTAGNLWLGLKEVLSSAEVRVYILVMSLGFGQMFSLLSSIQQVFDTTYGMAQSFPLWFAGIAAFSASASFINSRLVMRVGMRRLATLAYAGSAVLSLVAVTLIGLHLVGGMASFAVFYIWGTSIFFIAGLTFGNLNALAMQKLGHIAGMATSVITAISTVVAALIAAPVGLAYDGTAVPVIIGALICSSTCYLLMHRSERF
ncbi:MAG: multidrug MFS transporter [Rhodobacterales bacterium 32-67-9]|nr:MAG: multidrug MFS transporter [Rhodobacterales bacterium 32-67-9]